MVEPDGKAVDALIKRLESEGKYVRLSEADRNLIKQVMDYLRNR